jgi:hypothetical protein
MTRVELTLRPPGSGNHSPLVVTFDPRRRGELPNPLHIRRGDPWPINGVAFRVSSVRVQS